LARSFWKFKFFSHSIWRLIKKINLKKINLKKINYKLLYQRSSTIPMIFKNFIFKIHKGYGSRTFLVNKLNIGMKFGEFGLTRKPFYFPFKNKKSRKFRF